MQKASGFSAVVLRSAHSKATGSATSRNAAPPFVGNAPGIIPDAGRRAAAILTALGRPPTHDAL
eukprot:1988294-Pyramimonas_sp.AAC.1